MQVYFLIKLRHEGSKYIWDENAQNEIKTNIFARDFEELGKTTGRLKFYQMSKRFLTEMQNY
jgi:hypothetical protein